MFNVAKLFDCDKSDEVKCIFFNLLLTAVKPRTKVKAVIEEAGAGRAWYGVQIRRTNTDDSNFNTLKPRLANGFCEFVSEQFKTLGTDVLKATSPLFDLSNWPEDTTELATFGTTEQNVFTKHFHPVQETCKLCISGSSWARMA